MLLQKALRELNEEIDRLSRIRAIVAGLHSTGSPADITFSLDEAQTPADSAAPADTFAQLPAQAPVVTAADVATTRSPEPRRVRKVRVERTTRTRRPTPPQARALGGSIPGGPVFISSANMVKAPVGNKAGEGSLKSPKLMAPTVPPEGTLDALLRELSYRPSQGV